MTITTAHQARDGSAVIPRAEASDLHRRMRFSCEDAFLPYLRQALAKNAPEHHSRIRAQFAGHMDFLAGFCLRGYPGAGGLTVEFVKGLHQAIFPPGFRQEITTLDGHKIWVTPGDFKTFCNVADSHLHPGRVNVFPAPDRVPAVMAIAVENLNTAMRAGNVSARQDAILRFVLEFLAIHPFADANGRIACILADLLSLRDGSPPYYFQRFKDADLRALYVSVELAQETGSTAPMHALLAKRRSVETTS